MSPSRFRRKFTLGFITEWRKLSLPTDGGRIVLAVSGGADSCALACVVAEMTERKKLRNSVVLAHFDHGLRGKESLADAAFVKELASELGFEFVLGTAPEEVMSGKSNLEEKAREARYQFLGLAAENAGASHVLTAHTLNDQAETFLLNLVRGSGLTGLAGMPAVRPLGDGGRESDLKIVRPFLNWAYRSETVRYTREWGVEARIDAMNNDLSFARVKVRKELVPLLEEFNPNIIATLAATADGIARELDAIRVVPGEVSTAAAMAESESLRIANLKELSAGSRTLAVRGWLKNRRGSLRGIGRVHVKSVISLALSKKSGKGVELPGRGKVVRASGRLRFEKGEVEK